MKKRIGTGRNMRMVFFWWNTNSGGIEIWPRNCASLQIVFAVVGTTETGKNISIKTAHYLQFKLHANLLQHQKVTIIAGIIYNNSLCCKPWSEINSMLTAHLQKFYHSNDLIYSTNKILARHNRHQHAKRIKAAASFGWKSTLKETKQSLSNIDII